MTDREMLVAIYNDMSVVKDDIRVMKQDISDLKDNQAAMQQDISDLKDNQAAMQQDISDLKDNQAAMQQDIVVMKKDISDLKKDNLSLHDRLRKIELILENDVVRKIDLIAEGHLALNSKLDEFINATKKNEERLSIRISRLEARLSGTKGKNGFHRLS